AFISLSILNYQYLAPAWLQTLRDTSGVTVRKKKGNSNEKDRGSKQECRQTQAVYETKQAGRRTQSLQIKPRGPHNKESAEQRTKSAKDGKSVEQGIRLVVVYGTKKEGHGTKQEGRRTNRVRGTKNQVHRRQKEQYGGYMVAFSGRNYAARSVPRFVANSTHIITSFTL
ncbi:hypothetical protein KI387_029935, partial [Taxus chinensis]